MPGVDRECVTHHYACDCREEKFRNMENIIQDAIQSMEWMIADIDYKNKLDESPCDSPELIKAKETLNNLKQSQNVPRGTLENKLVNNDNKE